ncbi:MAG: 3'-5' exonuclease [Anaerolineales bacterium]
MKRSPQRQAIHQAQEILKERPVYLDTETTGMGKNDTVIEIAVLDADGRVLVNTLVQPRGSIPASSARIHGITDEMANDAPPWPEVWVAVERSLAGRTVAIYNVEFDLRVMKQTHTQHWMKWKLPSGARFVDVMELYAQYHGQWDPIRKRFRYLSLAQAGRRSGIPLPNTHRAKDDCLLTRALLQYLADQR